MNDMRGIEFRAGRVEFVPPLQGGKMFWIVDPPRGFTPGYHIAGFQPFPFVRLFVRKSVRLC